MLQEIVENTWKISSNVQKVKLKITKNSVAIERQAEKGVLLLYDVMFDTVQQVVDDARVSVLKWSVS